ncbi:hypothetical protein C7974DRAFT_93956 [Boeremia exigua]|uniref:uncharacterized protein n=1 Tax=Boeremia exigua TaxID=749465 RepID=UPI001E8D1F3C|nr:uncharacterized protein C7974DRAFT_93956 [Boeremia exigua]KAH6642027.1 hypothetical protein C7974DRAFT_93956 [Boeremia exigua]
MSPNLFLATQKLFSPHKWFRDNKTQERSIRKTEHWAEPTPGLYEYIPGRGWYLIAKVKEAAHDLPETTANGGPVQAAQDPPKEYEKLSRPVSVHWSRVIKRYVLEDDYKARKRYGTIQNEKGRNTEVGFFRLDDGVAWVHCWDQEGTFIPGPYKLWCISQRTGQFRPMLKGDDPNFAGSRNNSRSNSRQSSFERDADRASQESRSSEFYIPSRAGSTRDGPSVSSTRPGSIRMASHTTSATHSQPASRRASPKRNGSIEYEKDKAAMRQMARDHREALIAATKTSEAGSSKMSVEQIERGRSSAAKEIVSH